MTLRELPVRYMLIAILLLHGSTHMALSDESTTETPAVEARAQGPFAGLERLQPGRTMRSSSSDIWDWKNGNADARGIEPGETLVIADLTGPGRIQHIWNTIAASEAGASRLVVLRMYWDGEKQPSVEAPLGDFFVIGHGTDRAMRSLPVMVSSEGKARNCYWPMPFRKSAKITVTNEGKERVNAFYYYVDWQQLPSLPEQTPYFHALYRQEYPTSPDKDYLIADIEGRGHYVGTVLNVRQREGGWFGEGDDFFYIDGEKEPSLKGTGTEDYFCDAWGFREFTGPFYGVPVFEHYKPNGFITAYRWHINDPVSFNTSLRLEIEHKGAAFDEHGSVRSGYEVRTDDFASVAYWYQIEPHKPFPEFPKAEDRFYRDTFQTTEAEQAIPKTVASEGEISSQEGAGWSGNAQLFWQPRSEGQQIEIPFSVEQEGTYDIDLIFTSSWDYGIYEVVLNGEKMPKPLDLYSATIQMKKRRIAAVALKAGEQKLVLRNVGKSAESAGYFLGLDSIVAFPLE